MDTLERIATAVSDPTSADYQAFLSVGEIQALVAPTAVNQQRVLDALAAVGLTEVVNHGDAFDVRGPVSAVETFFSTRLYRFIDQETGKVVLRIRGTYTVPASVADMIVMVAGLSSFPVPHLNAKKHFLDTVAGRVVNDGDDATQSIVAQSLYQIYNIPKQAPGNATSTTQAVIEFEGQSYSPTDLSTYSSQVQIPVIVPTANTTVGPNDPTQAGDEAQLDIEAIATVNTEVFFFQADFCHLYFVVLCVHVFIVCFAGYELVLD